MKVRMNNDGFLQKLRIGDDLLRINLGGVGPDSKKKVKVILGKLRSGDDFMRIATLQGGDLVRPGCFVNDFLLT